jgi:hypothetical protein
MYIYLENDLADLDLSLDENGELLDFFSDFIYKSFKGKFIIDGKKALRNISKHIEDKRLKEKIKFIINRNMEYKKLFESLKFKISVSSGYTNVDKSSSSIKVPLVTLVMYDLGIVDFVAEDFNDSDYVDQAIRSFQLLNEELNVFRFKYNKINGGGANTPNVYEYHLNRNFNYVLCLCDSDKFSPKGPYGDNARECEKRLGPEHLSSLFITEGREIENDIPYTLIRNTFLNDPKTLKNITNLPSYKQCICNHILKFSDLKKGVTLHWIEKMPLKSENRKYWSLGARFIMDNYWHNIKDDGNTQLIPNISDKLLKNVSLFLKRKSDKELKDFLIENNASNDNDFYNFMSLGENFFWILFAFQEKKFVA